MDTEEYRQGMLADLDRQEEVLRDIICRDHFKIRRGKVVTDAAGRPVDDPVPARKAAKQITEVQIQRARLRGESRVTVMDPQSIIATVLAEKLEREGGQPGR